MMVQQWIFGIPISVKKKYHLVSLMEKNNYLPFTKGAYQFAKPQITRGY